jgi:hypothetical protein
VTLHSFGLCVVSCWFVSCAGNTSEMDSGQDAASDSRDGHVVTDATPVEVAQDRPPDAPDSTVTDAGDAGDLTLGDGGLPVDSGMDSTLPPPRDAPYEACEPDPCARGEACWTNGIAAGCVGVPTLCEPDASCLCLLQSATWCAQPTCADEGGALRLTCVPAKKGH